MKAGFDLAIVGAGYSGSLMAMVAHRLGLSVLLLEQGSHPRVVIGESTTPLSNLLLESLCAKYDLPRIAPLAKWSAWQRAYPQITCGLKRGFSFFPSAGADQLLVAASPQDDIADTHWYRSDVDHFLVKEAQGLGVVYRERANLDTVEVAESGATLAGYAGDEPFDVHARLLIDATGPRGFLHRALRLQEAPLPGLPGRECLYSHFTGVLRTPRAEHDPFAVDDAAVHHVFEGGWVWVLRFNNGVTSAGVAATHDVAQELALSEGEPAWQRVLDRLPVLQRQFSQSSACQPFRYMPQVGFRSSAIAGPGWAMLPSAAGFVDPLLSTGFPLTLLGIERLAEILERGVFCQLEDYAQQTEGDLLAAARLVGGLYATMGDFPAFTAVSLLYFVAVSFAETAHRLGKPELAPGFLLRDHPVFGPESRRLLARPDKLADEVLRLIEPFNVGAFGDPARHNRYPVCAEDLLRARSKLGASQEEILALLHRSGFFSHSEPMLRRESSSATH